SQVDKQREDFKRLGVSGDWENPYVTLTPDYEAAQIRVFGEMANKGYIYRGAKPVYWSWSSESALAEAEIEYPEKFGWADVQVLETYRGQELNHIVTEHPWDTAVEELVILGDHVTTDSGTGIVHTAPGFG
ncbi:class I tRNA ligase family protein, partial [Streptococcus pneumoniae]|uniref:class I tRNA ligase family protein n=1 Tax=Streptococcus pneumoniae TaxID=1313 RepID=UPI0012942EAF